MRLEDGKIENAMSGTDLGGSVRIITGRSRSSATSTPWTKAALRRLAGSSAARKAGRWPCRDTRTERLSTGAVGGSTRSRGRRGAVKARLLHLADETARALSKEIRQVVAVVRREPAKSVGGRLAGLARPGRADQGDVRHHGDGERDGLIQIGHDTLAHHGGFELLDDAAVARLATEAAQWALILLGRRPAPAGRMPVVLANGFGGVLFHEACGHGLEADYVLKKSSVWEGKIGQRVAGEHVFAYDDGVGAGHVGQRRL